MVFQIRGARLSDEMELLDADIKCCENAWSPDEWERLLLGGKHAISIATFFGNPVGFIVGLSDGVAIEVQKVAIKEAYRRRGVSERLLAAIEHYAIYHKLSEIVAIVPEHTVYPGPLNLSNWLTKLGFKPQAPFLKNHFTAYGEAENGVKFTRVTTRAITRVTK